MSDLKKIAIIGCGHMGSAFATRLAPYHEIALYNHHFSKAEALQNKGLGKAYPTLEEAVADCDAVILAIKPQNLSTFRPTVTLPLLISLLAGSSIAKLSEVLHARSILRVMPNLAIKYGEGLLGVVAEEPFSSADKKRFEEFLQPLGQTHWLVEKQMDAFTALAGSGPAFILALLEAMIETGNQNNLKDSQELVTQMVQGTLHLLKQSGQSPAELIAQIASPGGTTQAGLKVLRENHLDTLLKATFQAAQSRAKELS